MNRGETRGWRRWDIGGTTTTMLLLADTDVLIFSHIPWDTVAPRGLRLLNPGSPTDGGARDVTLIPVNRDV